MIPGLGKLPNDAKGNARFYIDGGYEQSAGGTVGAQISLWIWDGTTARPLIARDYTVSIDQSVGTRLEGDLLKVQQKKSFRTFFPCGPCEGRQTDLMVRVTPEGLNEIGEQIVVPELDAVDELFFRLIHERSAADVAAAPVIEAARRMVRETRRRKSKEEWEKFPTLGMMGRWKLDKGRDEEVLCLELDDTGPNRFKLRRFNGKLFISDVREAESCEE